MRIIQADPTLPPGPRLNRRGWLGHIQNGAPARAGGACLLTAILALAAAVLAIGCDGGDTAPGGGAAQGQQQKRDPIAVKLGPVRPESLPRNVEVVGTIYGDEEVKLSAKVSGRIQSIAADVGDRVAPGEVIARIEPTDYELVADQKQLALRQALATLGLSELPGDDFDIERVATVERARFQAANAKAKLERARQLFEQRPPLISEQDFADLETSYQVAQRSYDVALLEARSQLAQAKARASELATARQALADSIIRAPGGPGASPTTAPTTAAATGPAMARFGISQRFISEGEYVREGDALFQLVADDPVKFRAGVPERFVAEVKVGQDVNLRVEGQQQEFEGVVRRINPSIDVQSRTFQIEVLVPNSERLLRPGAFARGQVRIGEEPAFAVPRRAVVSFAGTDKVYTVREGKAVEILVQVVGNLGEEVAVRGKLEGVEQVVTGNPEKLANDVAVQVDPAVASAAP